VTAVAVLIPVLNRPHRVEAVLTSVRSSERDVMLQPLFLVNADDHDELFSLRSAEAPYWIVDSERRRGDFARKTNVGVSHTTAEWVFAGADDLLFHPGWADEAIRVADESGKRFVATNDLGNGVVIKGEHATHPLVHRSYIEECGTIDEDGKLYHEGYDHQYVDNEATETAKCRDEFVAASRSCVEHLHYLWRKGENDDVYRLGQSQGRSDQAIFLGRRILWS
jgi:glycosyltransferase involved in cell wall biosynthesis